MMLKNRIFVHINDIQMINLSEKELKDSLKHPIFRLISETADELGLECYVIGGYVRDIFLSAHRTI